MNVIIDGRTQEVVMLRTVFETISKTLFRRLEPDTDIDEIRLNTAGDVDMLLELIDDDTEQDRQALLDIQKLLELGIIDLAIIEMYL